MQHDIEDFIIYLATERGLSDNYQVSTRISLEGFALWAARAKQVSEVKEVTLQLLSEHLEHKKRLGLSAASIKLVVVALKIFFRWLQVRKRIELDPAEVIPLPRVERYLPETMNELQI